MKKFVVFALIVIATFCAGIVFADDELKLKVDDVAFSKEYKINGYVAVKFLGFKFIDAFAQWKDDTRQEDATSSYSSSLQASGNEADFAWLKADVRNLMKSDTKFMGDFSVKVIYDDEYEYKGWVRQFNYDYSDAEVRTNNKDIGAVGSPICLSPKDEIAIGPLYVGHYAFGCTLPISVVDDKDSTIRMIITMKGNEFTYNIR